MTPLFGSGGLTIVRGLKKVRTLLHLKVETKYDGFEPYYDAHQAKGNVFRRHASSLEILGTFSFIRYLSQWP